MKPEAYGSKRDKTRLLMKSFQLKEPIDYNDNFFSSYGTNYYRLVLCMVIIENLLAEQMDVKSFSFTVILKKIFT